MNKSIRIKRGLDLKLAGEAPEAGVTPVGANSAAVMPGDFPGFVPKLDVREGDIVAAGQPLMHDKNDERVKLCSPVGGRVAAVVRGERRRIERVVVEAVPDAPVAEAADASGEALSAALMASGLWAEMRQRPYDIVPRTGVTPRDIFVTAIDSAPLAPDLMAAVSGRDKELEAGFKALSGLTAGNVYVGVRPGAPRVPGPAVRVEVTGPHPAGNAGVIAANIAPVNKGETIWTLDIVTVARIGELVISGRRSFGTVVAVTGPETESPYMASTTCGAPLAALLDGHVKADGRNHRIISGNVLTGVKDSLEGYLHFPWRQVTVIAEGDDVDEFMGWASMSPAKMSAGHTFPFSALRRRFSPDARLNGGRRAMIMSGEYDKVFPMDIMPEYLIKAIGANDIDAMERLGIYEVAPEDFALCEYVDPSKTEIQKLVREGLDLMRKETE